MRPLRRAFVALERSPWILAVLAGLGVTLLVPSAIALFGPPELLDTLVALGDARLYASLLALFLLSACLGRVLLRRRRLLEEEVDDVALFGSGTGTKQLSSPPVQEEDLAKKRPEKVYLR
jgi:hypothetical protein